RPLGVGGEAVEAASQGVADLGQGLLKELVLAIVHLAQGDYFLAQPIDGRGAQGVIVARGGLYPGLTLGEVVTHGALSFRPRFGVSSLSTPRQQVLPPALAGAGCSNVRGARQCDGPGVQGRLRELLE